MERMRVSGPRNHLVFLPAALLLALSVLLAACGNPTAPLPSDVATPGTNGHYQVGQPAVIGTYVLTVDRVLYPATIGSVTPASGMKFLVLDLTIKTVDSQNDRLSPAAQLVVKDGSGTEYTLDGDVTPSTDFSTTQLPMEIPALGSIHGEVAYQVPVAASGLRLTFNASFLGGLIGHGRVLTVDLQ